MIAELGHYSLILALVLALVQSVVPVVGARRGDPTLMETAAPLALMQFLLVAAAFAILVHGYIVSDFSIRNVYENSHTAKPMIYKISGTWGNHEGSLLLWVLILTLFGAMVGVFGRYLPIRLKANVLGAQAWIAVAFLLFLLITSNPFWRLDPVPLEGQDLNPLLQDIGLAIHPPLLYVGYVGFSITFAFAVAALIEGRIDSAWARWVRPWALLAWMFLTIGIAMGSYWAYYELGWGGWWFWDPVENASFMPWLAGTALLHSAIVVEKRNGLRVWTVLLAILTFSLSLLGTFLVRSGVLTSVHSFATDPTRGIVILFILMIFIGGSLALFAWRSSSLTEGGLFAPVSREGALVLNNLFLSAATATVFIGTLYPLAYEAVTGEKISVGPPFFNLTMVPLTIPLLLAMPFGPFLAWKRGDIVGVMQRLLTALGLAIAAILIVFIVTGNGPVLAPLGIGLGIWLIAGAISELLWRAKAFQSTLKETLRRLWHLPRASFGAALGHAGMGMTVLGAVCVTAYGTESIHEMKRGDTIETAGFTLQFKEIRPEQSANYVQDIAVFEIRRGGVVVDQMKPAKRLYPARQFPTTEAAISTYGFSQLYLSLGDVRADGTAVVRAYWKPYVTLIWYGSLVMFAGGALSMADRRLRIGVPRKGRRPAASLQPAE
ncbi:MAG: heme lyase CcmF/NrfE family subunit [Rhizobiales bacterium]|nr:heme lyase CcmF/NrfE family subunit [Hyphomicrobiales bacterium]